MGTLKVSILMMLLMTFRSIIGAVVAVVEFSKCLLAFLDLNLDFMWIWPFATSLLLPVCSSTLAN